MLKSRVLPFVFPGAGMTDTMLRGSVLECMVKVFIKETTNLIATE